MDRNNLFLSNLIPLYTQSIPKANKKTYRMQVIRYSQGLIAVVEQKYSSRIDNAKKHKKI